MGVFLWERIFDDRLLIDFHGCTNVRSKNIHKRVLDESRLFNVAGRLAFNCCTFAVSDICIDICILYTVRPKMSLSAAYEIYCSSNIKVCC